MATSVFRVRLASGLGERVLNLVRSESLVSHAVKIPTLLGARAGAATRHVRLLVPVHHRGGAAEGVHVRQPHFQGL